MAKVMRIESGLDRISALPDELLCHILSFVPTKVAVCTSVLSTRWRRLYTMVSSLDFVTDGNADDVVKANQFMNSIERVLLFRTGDNESVERFRLKFHYSIDPLRLDGWIRALVLRNIRELDLCNSRQWDSASQNNFFPLPLPASLFSCKTLMTLKCHSFIQWNKLKIPAKVSLPNLKVLHIGKTAVSCYSVERLLSSCPVLDDLVLDYNFLAIHVSRLKFNICSATLKRLTITGSSFSVKEHSPQIVINCPALVYLNILLREQYSVQLVAAESLARVIIDAFPPHAPGYAYDVLKESKNIQSIQINYCLVKDLFIWTFHQPMFNKLTYLKICDCGFLFDSRSDCLEYILTRCVVLKTLVFERQHAKDRSKSHSPTIENLLLQSGRDGLLCHLKTVEIQLLDMTYAEVDALVKIIEFFLIRAKVLENLSIRVRKFPVKQQRMITKGATTLTRASKKCRVVVGKW